jgi:hypothetical protein
VLIAMVAPARADDERVRIKIPNPIPKIVKGIKRVGERVGDIVVRTAERIEGEEEAEEAHRVVPHTHPPPPPARVTVSIRETRPPVVSPSGHEDRLALVPHESARMMAKPEPPPAGVGRSADGKAVISAEAASRHMAASAAVSPSATGSRPAAGEQRAVAVNAGKPAPPPEHPFGKPVPGRQGLVYPPGLKEVPENMIDVRGIAPGTKVRDPVTKMVFRVP